MEYLSESPERNIPCLVLANAVVHVRSLIRVH